MEQKKTLSTLLDEYRAIEDMLVEASGEITPEIEAKLGAFGSALGEKLDGYAGAISYLKGQVEYLKKEAEQYTSRAKALSNSIEAMRERMAFAMEKAKQDKIKTEKHSFSLRNTKSWKMVDDLPNWRLQEMAGLGYGTFTFKPDMKAIKAGETEPPEWIEVTEKKSITIR